MSDLQYTITQYDPVNKILDVTFADNGWANIHLKTPIPTSQTELEEVIKQFAASQEVIDARSDTTVDLSYINSMVGKQYSTSRFSQTAAMMGLPPNTEVPSPANMQQMLEFQQLQQQKQMGDFLVKYGVLATNPITPEILNAARPTPLVGTLPQPIVAGMASL
jgi:hypothetical protein